VIGTRSRWMEDIHRTLTSPPKRGRLNPKISNLIELTASETPYVDEEVGQCSITWQVIEKMWWIVDLATENNEDAKKRKEAKYAQKESTLQPITKPKSKLDKELQEWE
jgi:hypothetical protein